MFVLFVFVCVCLSDDGWLHKAVEINSQLHIIEELQLFEKPQPVSNLLLSAKQVSRLTITCAHAHLMSNLSVLQYLNPLSRHQMSVYVSSPSGVMQLPLSSCHRYTSCYDCIFARDPHCAWNGTRCVAVMAQADRCVCVGGIRLLKFCRSPLCVFDLNSTALSASTPRNYCVTPTLAEM